MESNQEGDVLSDKKPPTEDSNNSNNDNNETGQKPVWKNTLSILEKVVADAKPATTHALQNWTDVRTSLNTMEDVM